MQLRNLVITLSFFTLLYSCKKEPSENITFNKAFGGTNYDNTTGIVKMPDGGYAIAGITESSDGDLAVPVNHPGVSSEAWVFKLSKTGELVWSKKFGGPGTDWVNSIINTADGGLMVAGFQSAVGGDVTSSKGGEDAWLIKFDKNGTLEWQRNYGGSGQDIAYSIIQDSNGDYVFCGVTDSNNGDVTNSKGARDAWVVKVSSTGTIIWQKNFGGSQSESGTKIISSPTGGYVILGGTSSGASVFPGYHGESDIFVINLAQDGSVVWQKAFGGTGSENAGSIVTSHTGGFVVSGTTKSTDGDVPGSRSSTDVWLFEVNNLGHLIWSRAYETRQEEGPAEVISTTDGYSIAGSLSSLDDHGNINGFPDLLMTAVDLDGKIINQKKIGGAAAEGANAHIYLGRDKYVVAGVLTAPIAGTSGYHSAQDAWVLTVQY